MERLYLQDPYLHSFTTRVTGLVNRQGQLFVTLDKTAFHPRGGGQPGDTGKIGQVQVLDTIEEGGKILHQVNEPVDGVVACAIDWDRRFRLMQMHTAQHLFTGCIMKIHDEAEVLKVFLEADESKIVLHAPKITFTELLEAEALVNQKLAEGLATKSHFLTVKEAKEKFPDVRIKEEKIKGDYFRVLEIDGFDFTACSGTHLKSTKEVSNLKVTNFNRRGAEVIVTFDIGEPAVATAWSLANTVLKLSDALRVEPEKLLSTVTNMKSEIDSLHERLRRLSRDKANSLDPKGEKVGHFTLIAEDLGEMRSRDVAELAKKLKGPDKIVFLYSFPYFVVSTTAFDARKLAAVVVDKLGGGAGGSPDFATGSVVTTDHGIVEFVRERVKGLILPPTR